MAVQITCTDTTVIDVHRHCLVDPFTGGLPAPAQTIPLFVAGLHETDAYSAINVKGITSILYPELMDIDCQIQEQD